MRSATVFESDDNRVLLTRPRLAGVKTRLDLAACHRAFRGPPFDGRPDYANGSRERHMQHHDHEPASTAGVSEVLMAAEVGDRRQAPPPGPTAYLAVRMRLAAQRLSGSSYRRVRLQLHARWPRRGGVKAVAALEVAPARKVHIVQVDIGRRRSPSLPERRGRTVDPRAT
jgi:hypothetical protein